MSTRRRLSRRFVYSGPPPADNVPLRNLTTVPLALAVARGRVLPRWVATGSLILTVINLAFVPSLFFGMNPSNFYAANGWGSTASIGGLNMLWIGAVGVAILRSSRQEVSR